MTAQHLIPIRFQCGIIPIDREIIDRLQISDKTVAVIQKERYTVFTVAWRADDLPADPETGKERPA